MSTDYARDMRSQAEFSTTSISRPKTRARTTISTLGGSGDQQIVCAIAESRGISPTVGLAFVNLSTTEAVLCQIADNQTYVRTLHKLHVLEPTDILLPNSATSPVKSKLFQVLETNLDFDAPLTSITRRYWDETAGSQYIERMAFKEDVEAIKVSVGGNYFATCCLSAARTANQKQWRQLIGCSA
ncbi:MAG: hypothetical protein LQ340_005811 [Diploschistes diacapsis]|nr:MAG: hypothetical protein LQ340_005811 [Diploschistes diacapsis]